MKRFPLIILVLVLMLTPHFHSDAAPAKSEFVRQKGDRLVVGPNDQTLHLRGVNFMGYFMVDQDNWEWYTEGEGKYQFPSPDEDKPVVLRSDWHNEDHFTKVAETGFNVIRVPLTYRIFEDNSNPGSYKPEGWAFVDKYITWAKQHNLYLILDMHIPQGGCQPCGGGSGLWTDPNLQIRFRNLWKAIAEQYANETIIAGYDLLNEPHPTSGEVDAMGDNLQWKTLAQQVVDDIRTVDQNHLLIVEAVNWVKGTGDWTLEVLESFQFTVDDDNVMYDIHFYFPYEYLFPNHPTPDTYPSTTKVRTIDGRMLPFNKTYLEEELKNVLGFTDVVTAPMNFGEWSGPAFKRDGFIEYISDLIDLYDQYGVHWEFWSFAHFYNGQMVEENLVEERVRVFEEQFNATTFIDVPSDHWAHDYIETLYQGGYIAGCNTDPLMYCPDVTMTRAESAVFVERGIHGAGYFPEQPTSQVFGDVPLWEWFAKWADGLWGDGYTAGCGTDPLIYCPLQEHTRTEGTVFFLRMLNGAGYIPPDPVGLFVDVPVDFWGAKWIEATYNAGLIPACETSPNLRFCPDDPLDRAMAAFMMVQVKGRGQVEVMTYDFDDGTTEGLPSRSCEKEPASCTELVTSPVRSGGYALRFTLKGTEFSRSEITLNDKIDMDVDYWIGFSTYLLTWDNSSLNSVIYQTHRAYDQPGTSPIIGLRATGSEWRLTYELEDPNPGVLWSGPIDKGSWVDWVVHVKYSASDSGLVELYKNGELVFHEARRTLALGTQVGPYDRFGIYHGVDETGTRELVYDEIRITSDALATYADVAPGS